MFTHTRAPESPSHRCSAAAHSHTQSHKPRQYCLRRSDSCHADGGKKKKGNGKKKKEKEKHNTKPPKTTSFLCSQQAADKLPLSSHLLGAVIYADSDRTQQFLISYKRATEVWKTHQTWRKTQPFVFCSHSSGGPINLQTLTHTHTMPQIHSTHAHKDYLLTQTFSNIHTIKEQNSPKNPLASHCQLSEEGKKTPEQCQQPKRIFHSNHTLLRLEK